MPGLVDKVYYSCALSRNLAAGNVFTIICDPALQVCQKTRLYKYCLYLIIVVQNFNINTSGDLTV